MAAILLSGRLDVRNSQIEQQAKRILKTFDRAHTESLYTGKPIRIAVNLNSISIQAYSHAKRWEKIPATDITLSKDSTLCILSHYKNCTTVPSASEEKPHFIYFNRHLPPAATGLKLSNKASKGALIIKINSFGDASIIKDGAST